MPILHVRALPQKDSARIQAALKQACQAIAEAYGCKPEQVWATWEEIRPGFYVEGGNAADSQPAESHPPIAELICFEGKSAEAIEAILLAGSRALSHGLGIPNNIFMTYREAASGQVVAGDGVIRKR
jgi:hypothetical protein